MLGRPSAALQKQGKQHNVRNSSYCWYVRSRCHREAHSTSLRLDSGTLYRPLPLKSVLCWRWVDLRWKISETKHLDRGTRKTLAYRKCRRANSRNRSSPSSVLLRTAGYSLDFFPCPATQPAHKLRHRRCFFYRESRIGLTLDRRKPQPSAELDSYHSLRNSDSDRCPAPVPRPLKSALRRRGETFSYRKPWITPCTVRAPSRAEIHSAGSTPLC